MKYVVINCCNREIYKVGEADTPSEATKIMKEDFMNEFAMQFNTYEEAEKAFNDGCGRNDDWDYDMTQSWLNGSCGNYDWRIIEVGD